PLYYSSCDISGWKQKPDQSLQNLVIIRRGFNKLYSSLLSGTHFLLFTRFYSIKYGYVVATISESDSEAKVNLKLIEFRLLSLSRCCKILALRIHFTNSDSLLRRNQSVCPICNVSEISLSFPSLSIYFIFHIINDF